jgi:hypothetical protein
MNAMRNTKGAITAIAHPDATAEMAMWYRDIIIMTAKTNNRAVVDAEENETWDSLKIFPVPLVRYMGKGTEYLQKL